MLDRVLFDQMIFDGSLVIQKSISDSGAGAEMIGIKVITKVDDSGQGQEVPSKANQIEIQDKNLPSISYF